MAGNNKQRKLLPIVLDGYKPLRDVVFETLRDAIIKQVLKPGERLMEIQLADEMGVSRTPVREAIRKLELEGLVVMVPRKGAYVAGVSMKDIHEVYEVRAALEMLAVSLAAERITDEELDALERQVLRESEAEANADEHSLDNIIYIDSSFHDIIYQAAHNQRLVQFVNILQEQLQRFRAASLSRPGRSKTALEEHKQIVEALAERNGELAAKLAKEHIDNAESAMISGMEESIK
ncbi:MAG: GntR family transcriptional regulator [Peptococcaceae bacterium]|nr:GntR family transcriptional regulator [Peptococcaceae bacterium]MBO5115106.1 GntR family transcriptional regulator [Peptococcaceae bacterium]MBO5140341.1 GntR family transcriptional regulator [Peptococcaceae bacterium]MBO5301504.1 GntR family transcriptional regulator [Peptococcaceae bacterium]MBO5365087.1 GntR family transcriptional regulator [Peptococcaceae bacterium]